MYERLDLIDLKAIARQVTERAILIVTALCIVIASVIFAKADEVAQSLRARLQSLYPEFRVSWLESVINAPFQRPDQAKYEEGLRKAGLPE
jgi:hypothetical protein